MMKILIKILPAFFSAFISVHAAPLVTLSADDVRSPLSDIKGVQISLTGPQASSLDITLAELAIQGKTWRNVRFSCHRFRVNNGVIRCEDGTVRASGSAPLPVTFHFSSLDKTLKVELKTTSDKAGEGWRLSARWGRAGWEGTLTVANGQAAQIAEFLPVAQIPSSAHGKINGIVRMRGDAGGPVNLDVSLAVDELAFSDARGLHAGENISVEVNAKAVREDSEKANLWKWQADVNWPRGEVFWQPLYFLARGQRFNASGGLDENFARLDKGKLMLGGTNEVDFSGVLDRSARTVRDFYLSADNLELAGLFREVLKPFLVNTPFAELKASGYAGIQWHYRNGSHELLDINLRDVSVEDENGRFSFDGVNAHIPWQADEGRNSKKPDIIIESSQLGRIPIGQVRIPLEITGLDEFGLRIPRMTVPVLDGELTLWDFNASRQKDTGKLQGWQWQFSGQLSPVSMQKLTEALEIPSMQGTLSGEIPRVRFSGSTVEVEGALLIKVFDGTVLLWNLKVLDPLGRASSFMADVDMRNLDLGLLTGAFSFGNMQGRIDVAMHDLELFNWKPVKFDASLVSSPGDYPRRISQAAVQNISSLGGSGAAAAIQRSFLGFFEEFGYSKIGWSCSLRNGICRMGGIESEPLPHGYLIVKGGGVPAITVIGYNRDVDWWELVNRLQRITQVNAKPVFQ